MSFDWIAPHYRWLEPLLAGRKLQRCRVAWLGEVRACRRVLVVGEGPGRFLERAVCAMPAAEFVCVDASAAMLERARAAVHRLGESARVNFVHASLPEWEPERADFDLIVTHFFLDCFAEPALSQVVARLASAAQPDAHWLLSDFQIPAAAQPGSVRGSCSRWLTHFSTSRRGSPRGGWSHPTMRSHAMVSSCSNSVSSIGDCSTATCGGELSGAGPRTVFSGQRRVSVRGPCSHSAPSALLFLVAEGFGMNRHQRKRGFFPENGCVAKGRGSSNFRSPSNARG